MPSFDGILLLYEAIFLCVSSCFLIRIFGLNHLLRLFFPPNPNHKPTIQDEQLKYPKIYTPSNESSHGESSHNLEESPAASTTSSTSPRSSDYDRLVKAYHWLENLTSFYVKSWIYDQNRCFKSLMQQEKYAHHVSHLSQKHQKYFGNGIKIVYTPVQRGKYYFYFKKEKQVNNMDEIQASLYCAKDIRQEGKLVLDMKQLLYQHGVIVRGTWISDDGYKLAYGISTWYKSSDEPMDMHMTVYVRDVVSGDDSDMDVIQGCRADVTSISWLEGHIGFFYTRYYYPGSSDDSPLVLGAPRVFFHRLRTSQDQDLLIYEDTTSSSKKTRNLNVLQEPSRIFVPIVTPDGHYLLIEDYNLAISNSIPICQQSLSDEMGSPCPGNRIYYRKLSVFDGKRLDTLGAVSTLIDSFDYRFDYIVNILDKFWFRTNYLAPGFRVVQVYVPSLLAESISSPASNSSYQAVGKKRSSNAKDSANSNENTTHVAKKKAWTSGVEYIPEHREGGILIRSFIASKTVILLQYLIRGSHEVMIFDLSQATVGNIPLTHPVASLPHPQCGAVTSINCSYHTNTIFYEFSNLADPCSVYRAIIRRSPTTGFVELSFDQLCRANIPGIDLFRFDLIQEQIIDISETCQIPIILFGHQDSLSNRDDSSSSRSPRPCILFAYGGHGVSCMPRFSLPFLLFVKAYDAIVCIVHAQGGGECGRVWHARGYKKFKYRPVDDIVAVAEYLIEKQFTSADRLALYSGAHGGIVCSRAAMRRPELFSAVVIEDGVFDLLSYPKRSVDYETSPSSPSYRSPSNTPTNRQVSASSNGVSANASTSNDDLSWVDEVGDVTGLSQNDEDFLRVLKLSPLHNAQELFYQEKPSSEDPTLALSMAASINKVKFPRQTINDSRMKSPGSENRISSASSNPSDLSVYEQSSLHDASTANISSSMNSDKKDKKMTPPAMLLCTSMDSSVHPSHTFKLTTELQRIAGRNKVKVSS
jgi:prolyl oligopeptidase